MSNPESNNIKQIFDDISQLINDSIQLEPKINNCINIIIECLKKDKKIILFGNGGSAADAQHIAAEFVGRFNLERKSYPAIALTTDSSIKSGWYHQSSKELRSFKDTSDTSILYPLFKRYSLDFLL